MIKYSKSQASLQVVATSPINIALIKYWGKLDDDYIIPCNSSLSITIDQNDLCSKTFITLFETSDEESKIAQDSVELILNGKKESITKRIQNVITAIRDRT